MIVPDTFPVVIKKGGTEVRIYRQGKEFMVAYYVGGRRKRETRSTYEKAKARADEIHKDFKNGNMEVMSLSRSDCLVFHRAKEIAAKHGVEVDEAVREWASLKAIGRDVPLRDAVSYYVERQNNIHPRPVPELCAELIAEKQKDGASSEYIRFLTGYLGAFSDSFKCDTSALSAERINLYLRSLKAKGRSRNNYRTAIVLFLNFAKAKKAIHQMLRTFLSAYFRRNWYRMDFGGLGVLPS